MGKKLLFGFFKKWGIFRPKMQKYENLLESSVVKRYATYGLIFKTFDFGENHYKFIIASSALFQIDLFYTNYFMTKLWVNLCGYIRKFNMSMRQRPQKIWF